MSFTYKILDEGSVILSDLIRGFDFSTKFMTNFPLSFSYTTDSGEEFYDVRDKQLLTDQQIEYIEDAVETSFWSSPKSTETLIAREFSEFLKKNDLKPLKNIMTAIMRNHFKIISSILMPIEAAIYRSNLNDYVDTMWLNLMHDDLLFIDVCNRYDIKSNEICVTSDEFSTKREAIKDNFRSLCNEMRKYVIPFLRQRTDILNVEANYLNTFTKYKKIEFRDQSGNLDTLYPQVNYQFYLFSEGDTDYKLTPNVFTNTLAKLRKIATRIPGISTKDVIYGGYASWGFTTDRFVIKSVRNI